MLKNFHGRLTTVVRAQNDTSKTANIAYTIFDRTYWYSPYKRRRFENRWDQTFCILLIKDVLSVIESANIRQRQNLKQKSSGIRIRIFGLIWIRMSVEYSSQNCGCIINTIVGRYPAIDRCLLELVLSTDGGRSWFPQTPHCGQILTPRVSTRQWLQVCQISTS